MVRLDKEKRKHVRKYLKTMVGVMFSPTGMGEKYLGLVDNVSSDGVGITSDVRVTPGTLLEIMLNKVEEEGSRVGRERSFFGEVRWCSPGDWDIGVYHFGVKMIHGLTV